MFVVSNKIRLYYIYFYIYTEIGRGRLTVGKIYGGLLILENWKATKFGKMAMNDAQVC